MPWYILDWVTTLGDVNLCSKAYSFQSSRYLWNANTAGHSWLGNVINYSLYYLIWRSLHSSGLAISLTIHVTTHPYVSHMYENSISRRYSQYWLAAKVVSSHYSAYIESIYLNRMKMWCERPRHYNTTRQAASLTGLLHTGFSRKKRSISKRRFGKPFFLHYRWNTLVTVLVCFVLFFFSPALYYVSWKSKDHNMLDHHIVCNDALQGYFM